MGKPDVESHSLERSRARIGVIADELSRRATPEQLKAEGRELVDKAKARAIEKKDELTAQAKEKAREKFTEIKEQAMASPTAYAMLGGLTGAVAGALVGKRMKAQSEEEYRRVYLGRPVITGQYPPGQYGYVPPPTVGYEERGGFQEVKTRTGEKVEEVKGKAGEVIGAAQEKASEVAETVKEKAQAVTEKLPSVEDMKASGRRLMRNDPWLIAFGAVAIGAAAAFLLPLTDSERRVFSQAQEAARRGMRKVTEAVEEKIAPEEHEEEEIAAEPYGSEQPPAIH